MSEQALDRVVRAAQRAGAYEPRVAATTVEREIDAGLIHLSVEELEAEWSRVATLAQQQGWMGLAGPPTEERKRLANEGKALNDGSYPIRNVSDLKKAIQAAGRAKDFQRAKRWIMKRARALNAENLLPDKWKSGSGSESSGGTS